MASPDYIERYGMPTDIRQLTDMPSACYARRGFVRDKIHFYDDKDQIQVIDMKPSYKCSSSVSLIASVKAGMYYTMITDHCTENGIEKGELIQLFPKVRLPEDGAIYAVYPSRALSFGARLFIDTLKVQLSG